ncbi:MAG: hypothetical protein EBQ92_00975 [Proteobacteria bacterium]|nr:hypothetical protein [Pseudomonadota bacterium]
MCIAETLFFYLLHNFLVLSDAILSRSLDTQFHHFYLRIFDTLFHFLIFCFCFPTFLFFFPSFYISYLS